MKKPKIFIACDTNKISKVKKIISETRTNKLDIGYKFGLEFFYSKGGREFISKLKSMPCLLLYHILIFKSYWIVYNE